MTRGLSPYPASIASMASRVCWKCGTKSHMTGIGPVHNAAAGEFGSRALMRAFSCDECKWLSIGITGEPSFMPGTQEAYLDTARPMGWLPNASTGREFAEVPEHIAAAASEAYECHSVQAYRAATLMARSVIEATAKEKGITTGRLIDKIDRLFDEGHTREHVRDGAHEVRHFGNDMAHGDFVKPVLQAESDEVLELMAEVLNDVFQSPARVARRKAAREAAKEAQQPHQAAP